MLIHLIHYIGYLSIGYSGFDLDNIGKAKGQGGSCTAAAFLKVHILF